MFKRFRHQVLNLGIILMFLLSPCLGWSQTNYSVLDFWKYYSDAENLLYNSKLNFLLKLSKKERNPYQCCIARKIGPNDRNW